MAKVYNGPSFYSESNYQTITAKIFFSNVTYTATSSGVTNISGNFTSSEHSTIYYDSVSYSSYTIYVNNVSIKTKSANGAINETFTYSYSTPLTFPFYISFAGSCRASDSYNQTTFNGTKTFQVYTYNGSADFVFVDTATYSKLLLLPSAVNFPTNKIVIIKDKSNNANTNNIYVIPPSTDKIDILASGTSFNIADNSGCLTLFCVTPTGGPSQYFIANYYPSINQGVQSSNAITPTGRTVNDTISNPVSIFSTDVSGSSGTNLCILPAPAGFVGIHVVAYGGSSANPRTSGNDLYFKTINNTRIDNNSYYYYICSDAGNNKSLGMVFISDGTTWYIVGLTAQNSWIWDAQTFAGTAISATRSITLLPDITQSLSVILPYAQIPTSCMVIIKARNVSGQYVGVNFQGSDGVSGHTQNLINTSQRMNLFVGHYLEASQSYECVWFVSQPSGSTTIYYPVIQYRN